MGEPERLNGLLRENVVPVIGLRPPDMLQCALRGMGVVGDDRDVLLVFAGRFIRAHHQVLMFQSSDCDPPTRFRVSFQSSATTAVPLSATGFFALITKFSCLNSYCSQRCNSLSPPQLAPSGDCTSDRSHFTLAEPAPINAVMKSPSAIIGDGDAMVLPDMAATIFEGEAHFAVVIGKRASHVKATDAMSYIFGYTNFIDGSARGVVPPTNVFYQMKSRDTFAPIGPYIVTDDEIKDPHKLQIKLTNNGVMMQNFNTDDMAHKIPRCIEWVTSIHTLQPGDILATGTNHRGLNPFMDGDKIELTCEGCGTLHITVRDDLKRTWSRITRLQHKQSGAEGVHTKQTSGKYGPMK